MNNNTFVDQNDKLIRNIALSLLLAAGFFLGWSYFSTLDAASIAQGTVVVESKRKSIQHLNGGMVSDVYVREGQYVKAGSPLIQVSDVELLNRVQQSTLSWISHDIQHQRLLAERAQSPNFVPSIELSRYPELSKSIEGLILNQKSLFESRIALRKKEQAILASRITQSEQTKQASERLLIQKQHALLLLHSEIEMHKKLLKDGFTSRLRLLELERSEALLKGDLIGVQSDIDAAKASLSELEHQVEAIIKSKRSEIETEIAKLRIQLASLEYDVKTSNENYQRSIVYSPTSGIVLGLSVHSTGEVIGAGEVLMEIVPTDDQLVIEALVKPTDIDDIVLGQQALVRLSAYDFRTTPMVEGKVFYIDADRTESQDSSKVSGYKIKVKLSTTDVLEDAGLVPGMPAEVYVLTKQKRPIDYLLEPLTNSFLKAFRES